jgi:hypothetical protein
MVGVRPRISSELIRGRLRCLRNANRFSTSLAPTPSEFCTTPQAVRRLRRSDGWLALAPLALWRCGGAALQNLHRVARGRGPNSPHRPRAEPPSKLRGNVKVWANGLSPDRAGSPIPLCRKVRFQSSMNGLMSSRHSASDWQNWSCTTQAPSKNVAYSLLSFRSNKRSSLNGSLPRSYVVLISK